MERRSPGDAASDGVGGGVDGGSDGLGCVKVR